MSNLLGLAVGLIAGAALGAMYFLWLGWAMQGMVDRRRRGLWVVGNLIGRIVLALVCFGLLMAWGGWTTLAAAVVAFVVTRILLLRRMVGEKSLSGSK